MICCTNRKFRWLLMEWNFVRRTPVCRRVCTTQAFATHSWYVSFLFDARLFWYARRRSFCFWHRHNSTSIFTCCTLQLHLWWYDYVVEIDGTVFLCSSGGDRRMLRKTIRCSKSSWWKKSKIQELHPQNTHLEITGRIRRWWFLFFNLLNDKKYGGLPPHNSYEIA